MQMVIPLCCKMILANTRGLAFLVATSDTSWAVAKGKDNAMCSVGSDGRRESAIPRKCHVCRRRCRHTYSVAKAEPSEHPRPPFFERQSPLRHPIPYYPIRPEAIPRCKDFRPLAIASESGVSGWVGWSRGTHRNGLIM